MGGYSLSISKKDAGGGGRCSVDFLRADLSTRRGVVLGSGSGDSDPTARFGSMLVVTGEKDTVLASGRLGIDSHKLSEFWSICCERASLPDSLELERLSGRANN